MRAVQETNDNWARAEMLAMAAPFLPEREVREAIKDLEVAEDGWRRSEAQRALALRLAKLGGTEDALTVARGIRWEEYRAKACAQLSACLPEPARTESLEEALVVVRTMPSGKSQAEALIGIAPYLPESALTVLLSLAGAIPHEPVRIRALIGIAPYLSGVLLCQAVGIAQEIPREHHRIEALAGLIPLLATAGNVNQALTLALSIQQKKMRLRVLAACFPYLDAREQELAHSVSIWKYVS